MAGSGPGRSAATTQLVPPRHVELGPVEPEDLDDDAELERGDPRGDERDDAMWSGRARARLGDGGGGGHVARS